MRMIFPLNINLKRKKKKHLLGVAIVALILIIIFFRIFSFSIVNKSALYIIKPFLYLRLGILNRWEELKINFSEKKYLQEENKSLREEISQLEIKAALNEVSEKENVFLKSVFSAEEARNFILASVILRPPLSPYGVLIIDAGSKKGAKEGMQVLAAGNVLLGHITDVSEGISKVKLISSFNEETNVILESSGISAIAMGTGGENFEIILPRQIKIEAGEKVLTLGVRPNLIGIVEKIERQDTDPYQKIIFRFPLNIQYLNQVFLLKK